MWLNLLFQEKRLLWFIFNLEKMGAICLLTMAISRYILTDCFMTKYIVYVGQSQVDILSLFFFFNMLSLQIRFNHKFKPLHDKTSKITSASSKD